MSSIPFASPFLQVDPAVKEFHEAISDGNKEVVAEMLAQENIHPEAQSRGVSPLSHAIDKEHVEIARMLIEAGAGVDFGGKSGRFPLYVAATRGNLQLIKLLIESGAKLDLKYMTGNTPLLQATLKGYEDVVPYLISAGANPQVSNNAGETGLHLSAARGQIEVMKTFLDAGLDVNVTRGTPLTKKSERRPSQPPQGLRGYRPLHLAVHAVHGRNGNHVEAVKFLLAHGADVDASLKNGRTALHIAASRNAVDTAALLLSHGCHVDPVSTENDENKTPLLTAVDAGNIAIVELLLEAGADINFKDSKGFSPLLAAVFSGKVRIAMALLRAGCDVNLCSSGGFSAFRASLRHPPHLTQMLVIAGYDLNAESLVALDEFSNSPDYAKYVDVRAWIKDLAVNPLSLQQQCRFAVRRSVQNRITPSSNSIRPPSNLPYDLRRLPLPESTIDFLNLKDLDDIYLLYKPVIIEPTPGYVILETDS